MKKMKVILVLLAIAVTVPFFNGCKKGENDPFISLRSRDARLMGEWTVSKIEGTRTTDTKGNNVNITNYTNSLTTNTTTFDGSTLTSSNVTNSTYYGTTTTLGGGTKTYINSYSVAITIEEHGVVKVIETETKKTLTQSSIPADNCGTGQTPSLTYNGLTCDGTYTYTTPTTTTNTYEGIWFWGTGKKNKETLILSGVGSMDGLYMVTQLKNKEIVLTQNSVDNDVDSGAENGSTSISDKTTVTLTAK